MVRYLKTHFLFKIILDIIALFGILFQVISLFHMWATIRGKVPVHFDLFGRPDAWGEKKSLLLIPLITIIIFSALTVFSYSSRLMQLFLTLPKLTPETEKLYGKISILIQLLKADIIWLFSCLEFQILRIAMGKQEGLGYIPVIFIIIAVVIVVLFNITKFKANLPR